MGWGEIVFGRDAGKRAVLLLAISVAIAGCALKPKPKRYFVHVAEGLSSPSVTEGISVAPRMFTASQLTEACRKYVRVDRLNVAPKVLELAPGNTYALNSLTVVAVNPAEVAVPGVPIVVEAEDSNPPILQLRSDDPDLNAGRLRVVGTGEFRVRVRTTCGTPPVETIIKGKVR